MLANVISFNNDGNTLYEKPRCTQDKALWNEIQLIREDDSAGVVQMRRRENNNCSGACTLGSRKAARIRARVPRKREKRREKRKKVEAEYTRDGIYVRECTRLWK